MKYIKIKFNRYTVHKSSKLEQELKIKNKIESVSPTEIKMEGIYKKEVGDFLTLVGNNSNFKLREVLKDCIEIEK